MTEPMRHLGNPASELTLGGRRFRVARATRKQREALERYAADRTPQPLQTLIDRAARADPERGPLYRDLIKQFVGDAMRAQDEWPPRFGSEAFRRFYLRDEHAPEFLRVALCEHNDITPDELDALCGRAAEADPDQYSLDIINITRRFLYGAERPLTLDDLRRMEERDRAAQAEQIAGAVGALKNAAARLGEGPAQAGAAPGSPTSNGGASPGPSRGPMAGRPA